MRIYRAETVDLVRNKYAMNSATTYHTKPDWWPGITVEENVSLGLRYIYSEGVITWERPELPQAESMESEQS